MLRTLISSPASSPLRNTLRRSLSNSTGKSDAKRSVTLSSTASDVLNDASKPQEKDKSINNAVPDVSSTSLGLDDPVDDPLKWKKFAWKYAGALVVFGVAYTGLNRYGDHLMKEKKERERGKEKGQWNSKPISTADNESPASGGEESNVGTSLRSPAGGAMTNTDNMAVEQGTSWQVLPSITGVKEITLNERDELELRELELASRLKEMQNSRSERWEANEIKSVERELREVERELARIGT